MKAVILAGGLGTRLAEETSVRPKPMVEIGGRPILWHIMKSYSFYGINDFVICCGYKGYLIKEYFANYFLHMSDITFDMKNNDMQVHREGAEHWTVTLLNTGDETMTGGRLLRIKDYVQNDEAFCLTYGDGVSDINISASINFHKNHGKLATVTATHPPARFGTLDIINNQVKSFQEKPKSEGGMVNGGYFVLSPKVFALLKNDQTIFEQEPLTQLAENGQLMAYKHNGFWQPMDTLRDKQHLQKLWDEGKAPWRQWK